MDSHRWLRPKKQPFNAELESDSIGIELRRSAKHQVSKSQAALTGIRNRSIKPVLKSDRLYLIISKSNITMSDINLPLSILISYCRHTVIKKAASFFNDEALLVLTNNKRACCPSGGDRAKNPGVKSERQQHR